MLIWHRTPTKKCKNNLKLRLKNVILTYNKWSGVIVYGTIIDA